MLIRFRKVKEPLVGHKVRVPVGHKAQNWSTLATLEGAKELLNNFVEIGTVVFPRKKPVEVTT